MAKYCVGQKLVEDRTKWLNTEHEYAADRKHPVVHLEIIEVNVKENKYIFYNHTLGIKTFGDSTRIDLCEEIGILM